MDKRHTHRMQTVQKLFPLGFEGINPATNDTDPTFNSVVRNLKKIDLVIQKYAPRYPLKKIAKVDLAILRLSMYELLFEKKQPPKVIIDEAVILAREFGNEKSYSFINGVLGSALKESPQNETS